MSKPEFGTKHICEACAARFYDLNRFPVTCFRCGAPQAMAKSRAHKPLRAPADRGGFGRRLPLIAVEEKPEPDDLVTDDVEETDLAEEDADMAAHVEVDPNDDEVLA